MGIEEIAKNPSSLAEKDKGKEKEKGKVFLQVLQFDQGGFRYTEFFTIDMRTRQVLECPYALLANRGFSSMVSLGSVVYVVGGVQPRHIKVQTKPPHSRCTKKGIYHKCMSYLDLTSDTGDGWTQGPCFSEGPCPTPAVVAFGGKIYLFRLGEFSKAEVFDPISNKWEELLPPPSVGHFSTAHDTSAVADPQNNRILVHFESILSVFAYYPANSQWELVLQPFNWSYPLVFADGLLFVYLPEHPKLITAYDLATKRWLNIVFPSELSPHVWRTEFDAMFYLGNDIICLARGTTDVPPSQTHVYLRKFYFKQSTCNPNDLFIAMLPEETYDIGVRTRVHSFLPI